MRKIVLGVLVVFSVLAFSGFAQARIVAQTYPKFGFGVVLGSYSPNCQEWNDYLGKINDVWDMSLALEKGEVYGLNVAVDITPNIRVRGELTEFSTGTSDTGYDWWGDRLDVDAQLNITSFWGDGVLLLSPYQSASGLFVTPYIGGGIGYMAVDGTMSATYTDSWWSYYNWSANDSASDSTVAGRIIGGIEGRIGENFEFALEGNYTVTSGTDLKFSKFDQEFKDSLGGVGANILLNFKI